MKAPDKIYLHKIRDEGSSGFYKMWFEQRAGCVPSEEYIRKDALIEWLEGKMTAEGAAEGIIGGYDMAIKDVINKINSI